MKIRATRGVCIGVERHLLPGDTADVDEGTAQFLVSTGAVERVIDPPAAPDPEPETAAGAGEGGEADPPKSGKKKAAK